MRILPVSTPPPPAPDVIGYQDDSIVYLNKGAAYKAVYGHLANKGEAFPISEKTLMHRLADGGYLELGNTGNRYNNVNRLKPIGGKNQRCLFLFRNRLEPAAQEGEVE